MKKDTPDYPLDAHAHTYTLEPADLDIRTYGVGGWGRERMGAVDAGRQPF